MILRLVFGFKVVCLGFVIIGVNIEFRRLFVLEVDVGEIKVEFICMGVIVVGVVVDFWVIIIIDDVLDVDGEICVKLIFEDGWGDFGFEGCIFIIS